MPGDTATDDTTPLDHIQLGRQLDIFTTDPLVGPGLPLWLPDGAAVRHELQRFTLELERQAGYHHVITPSVAKQELYQQSGHWEFYAEDMFPPMGEDQSADAGQRLVLRPVNCPHHVLIYRHAERSYRDLPLRLAELGDMYRMERSGVVAGLSRVRAMTLNDGHVFCRPEQVGGEVRSTMELVDRAYRALHLQVAAVRLCTRDGDDSRWAGSHDQWMTAEAALRAVLEQRARSDPRRPRWTETPGDAAFYGPKIDIDVTDVHGRRFTLSTVQVDLWMPDRFDLSYIEADGSRRRPVMVHRSVLSTAERLMAFLLERTQGRLPFWLAPQQVRILPVSAAQEEAARHLDEQLRLADVRGRVIPASRSLGSRIRQAVHAKVPVVLILGEREVDEGTLTLRLRGAPTDMTGVTPTDLRDGLVDAAARRLPMPEFV